MKRNLFFITSILLISCGGAKLMAPTETDLERGRKTYADLTMEDLNTGKANFEQQCSKCHKLKRPRSKNETQWRKIVPKMAAKARKKAGREIIDPATQESILKYLVTMAKY